MHNFFAELKRRHIYRVAAAYAVVSWVLLQLVNNVAPLLRLPDWAGSFFLVMLAVGFPIALIFAWTMELKRPLVAERAASSKTDWILTGALATVIALILYEQLAPRQISTTTVQAGVAALTQTTPSGISIAVLPFVNLSGDAGQEFFSDGMTEEITSALAKVQGLKVIGRTSAFQFKGQNQDLRAIGQALSVGYLIEGSVRKAGDQVRITAQLIKANDGTHLWTENYDRQLVNIFATQDDIAQAIAGALRVPLGLAQGESLVSNRTGNLASYQEYLRGKALVRAQSFDEAIKVLEREVASNPGFAPAWAFLARAYNGMQFVTPAVRISSVEDARRIVQSYRTKGEMAAREAVRLDPKLATGYSALAFTLPASGAYAAKEDFYRQALALDANDPESLDFYSRMLADVGRLRESLDLRKQLRTQEPLVPVFNAFLAIIMRANGEDKAAIPILEALRPTDPLAILFYTASLAQAYAADGRYSDAADVLLSIPDNNFESRQTIEDAARLLRQAPTKVSPPETLPVWREAMSWIYIYVGAPERLLEIHERNIAIGSVGARLTIWLPEFAQVRKTERFKTFVRNAGIVDYWRARGWSDLCRPVGADDFVCD